MKTLGIIGGVGPETTAEFYLDVMFECQKGAEQSRPGIIIASVPLPYEIEEDLIRHNTGIERYIPYLVAEAKRLESAGADVIVMPCNSLHVFITQIRNAVSVPVLSIIEETVAHVEGQGFASVGIVSTSTTIQHKLYENAFGQAGVDYATPDDFEQAKMGKYIHNLVMGQHRNTDREGLIAIIDKLASKNVDAVALACTDLQLLLPTHHTIPVFDTMKVLSRAAVREIRK